jgi:type II secretion system protein G
MILKSYILNLKSQLKQGFTLIELLIVIAIIGVLTALVTTNLQGARSRARDTRRKSDLHAIEQSLRLYYNDAKQFPASDVANNIVGCNTIAAPSACSWGGAFATSASTYMSSLPLDPSSSDLASVTYKYFSTNDDKYLLIATLENSSDQDISDSQDRCASLYGSYSGSKTETDYLVCAE